MAALKNAATKTKISDYAIYTKAAVYADFIFLTASMIFGITSKASPTIP